MLFFSLPKKGKPTSQQWTTLAGFVIEWKNNNNNQANKLTIASIATGTKCVTGKSSEKLNVIIDCHAEVLAKRGFKRFLMAHHKNGNNYEQSAFDVHLFVSQLPCGTIERYKGTNKRRTKGW